MRTWKPKGVFLWVYPLMSHQSPSKIPESYFRYFAHYCQSCIWIKHFRIIQKNIFPSWDIVSQMDFTKLVQNICVENQPVPLSLHFPTLKSIVPLLSASKVLKTFSQNLSASPAGKNILYISQKVFGVSFPLGQSCTIIAQRFQWAAIFFMFDDDFYHTRKNFLDSNASLLLGFWGLYTCWHLFFLPRRKIVLLHAPGGIQRTTLELSPRRSGCASSGSGCPRPSVLAWRNTTPFLDLSPPWLKFRMPWVLWLFTNVQNLTALWISYLKGGIWCTSVPHSRSGLDPR